MAGLIGKLRVPIQVHDEPASCYKFVTKLSVKDQDFIREHAPHMTCVQLGRAVGVDDKTIRRFCKNRGITYLRAIPVEPNEEARKRGTLKGARAVMKEGWPNTPPQNAETIETMWYERLKGRLYNGFNRGD